MNKLPALVFLLLGVAYFLHATNYLALTSETALVGGSMGLVPGVCAAIAALLTSSQMGRAIGVGLVTGLASAGALVAFYTVIWPML